MTDNYIGIDIAKHSFDVYHTDNNHNACFENTDICIETFAQRLAETDPVLVVMEATGG